MAIVATFVPLFVLLELLVVANASVNDNNGTIIFCNARFQVLAPLLFRLEYSASNTFEDRPSVTFTSARDLRNVPSYSTSLKGRTLTVTTALLTLCYACQEGAPATSGFLPQALNITLRTSGVVWHPGAWGANLNGSVPTMDCYLGAKQCVDVYMNRFEPGLLSRTGWTLVDDSTNALLDFAPWPWRIERAVSQGYRDWYFFGYGSDYAGALRAFVSAAGAVPLMDYGAYGVWWSRYWPYNETGIMDVVEGYAARALPLHFVVLDMDWHIETPAPGSEPPGPLGHCNEGWGGYEWNRTLFADPALFQETLHARGLQLVANVHDQCGVQHTQGSIYTAMAERMGINPVSNDTVPCHFQNKRFASSLYEIALDVGENAGVDYYWTDLCDLGDPGHGAGNVSNYRCDGDVGSRAALWNNVVHASRGTLRGQRGLVLSIYGGLGNHRYPQVGSGDTFAAWETLEFEVYLTLTAANVAVAWTHDLGGFQVEPLGKPSYGIRDPEMFLRFLQFGLFSPLFRTHCDHCDIVPWHYPNFQLLAPVYRFRQALMPYLYTTASDTRDTGILLVHPLYYDFPAADWAYEFRSQYLFGADMMVSPIVQPVDGTSRVATKAIVIPPGDWIEWCSGTLLSAPLETEADVDTADPLVVHRNYTESQIPVFVRAGSIFPLRDSLVSAPSAYRTRLPGSRLPVVAADPAIFRVIPAFGAIAHRIRAFNQSAFHVPTQFRFVRRTGSLFEDAGYGNAGDLFRRTIVSASQSESFVNGTQLRVRRTASILVSSGPPEALYPRDPPFRNFSFHFDGYDVPGTVSSAVIQVFVNGREILPCDPQTVDCRPGWYMSLAESSWPGVGRMLVVNAPTCHRGAAVELVLDFMV